MITSVGRKGNSLGRGTQEAAKTLLAVFCYLTWMMALRVIALFLFFKLYIIVYTSLCMIYFTRKKRKLCRSIFDGLCVWECCSVVFDSLRPHGLYSTWNSLGQNTGVGSLSLFQGIFPIQGSNPGLPHSRLILYQLNHKGSPLMDYANVFFYLSCLNPSPQKNILLFRSSFILSENLKIGFFCWNS